jgi:D-alanyl-D-alanine carboxypeptidase
LLEPHHDEGGARRARARREINGQNIAFRWPVTRRPAQVPHNSGEQKHERGNMPAKVATCTAAAIMLALAPAASAGPALLIDAADHKVLYAEDQDNQWHPASLTKIMTAYVTFEAIKEGKIALDTKIGCSELAHSQPPSKIGLPVGAEMTVETGLQALIIKSANDVAVMLAEAVAGSQEAFVERMNATAQRLGMTRTKFVNANGLPAPEQITTARDMAKLAVAVVRDHPAHAQLWSMVDMRVGKRRLRTHNGLLVNYEGADGIKTGFICDSGFNVVASATRQGRKLIAVVLGEATGRERTMRAANLLQHGFEMHEWKVLFGAQTLDAMPVAADAKGPMTMRQAVISYECGTARRRVAKRKTKAQAVAASKAKAGTKQKAAPAPAAKSRPKQKAAAVPSGKAQ